jgi:hypothetical protein
VPTHGRAATNSGSVTMWLYGTLNNPKCVSRYFCYGEQ